MGRLQTRSFEPSFRWSWATFAGNFKVSKCACSFTFALRCFCLYQSGWVTLRFGLTIWAFWAFEEPGYLATLFQFFRLTAWVLLLKRTTGRLIPLLHSTKAFGKSNICYEHKEKYTGSYLPWVSVPMRFGVGTQNIGQQRSALKSILAEISPAAALALQGAANEWVQGNLRKCSIWSLQSIFKGEIYFGQTQAEKSCSLGRWTPNKKNPSPLYLVILLENIRLL